MIKKKYLLMIACSLLFIQLQAQSGSVPYKVRYGTKDRELQDLIQLENIDYQTITFTGSSLIGKHFIVTAKEIWSGEVTTTSIIANSLSRKPIADSVFEVRVISKLDEQKNISMHFHFPDLMARKQFKTTGSALYSLRNVLLDSKKPFVTGKRQYFLAHILPIPVPGSPDMLSYCNVDDSGEDVMNWGKKLGIPHYIVFELEIF
ncbi:hypothetical protein [Pseudobacter ginsenosidimutans]|uniref:Uncharacterized protein n=1 Tax=Pseudobacter ginsenosidimutans TaxID=661488 RepID=A0A4Q7MSA5_9BACT|nr:hypothetical protein [Pseudobacter ginsenosidimutans]QEC41536.1 hypothetical protein FSB84_07430 [Pseudobacter ginsenosidimutans]RZS71682.1 hypothetical protein EV199_3590 [Pseudobacter ginsenosidimutans]